MILSPFDPAAFAPIAALLAKVPADAAPARGVAHAPEVDDLRLTADEASGMLRPGDVIHVVGPSRERWSRQRVREALRSAVHIRLTLTARTTGFGLSVDRRGAESLLIETDRNEVAAWLARQADSLTKE